MVRPLFRSLPLPPFVSACRFHTGRGASIHPEGRFHDSPLTTGSTLTSIRFDIHLVHPWLAVGVTCREQYGMFRGSARIVFAAVIWVRVVGPLQCLWVVGGAVAASGEGCIMISGHRGLAGAFEKSRCRISTTFVGSRRMVSKCLEWIGTNLLKVNIWKNARGSPKWMTSSG